jgi:hypothetical protein
MLGPSLGVAFFFAIVAAYSFVLIARICEMTGNPKPQTLNPKLNTQLLRPQNPKP